MWATRGRNVVLVFSVFVEHLQDVNKNTMKSREVQTEMSELNMLQFVFKPSGEGGATGLRNKQ